MFFREPQHLIFLLLFVSVPILVTVLLITSVNKKPKPPMVPVTGVMGHANHALNGEWILKLPDQPEMTVGTHQLQLMARNGTLQRQTLVRHLASGNYYSAEQIPGVFE